MGKEMITKRIIPIVGGVFDLPIFGFLLLVGILNGTAEQIAFCLLALSCLVTLCHRLWKEISAEAGTLGFSCNARQFVDFSVH